MTLILYFLKMGLRKEIERPGKIIEVLNEMFEQHDEMIHNQLKMNGYLQEQIKIQGKMINNITEELRRILKKEEINETKEPSC